MKLPFIKLLSVLLMLFSGLSFGVRDVSANCPQLHVRVQTSTGLGVPGVDIQQHVTRNVDSYGHEYRYARTNSNGDAYFPAGGMGCGFGCNEGPHQFTPGTLRDWDGAGGSKTYGDYKNGTFVSFSGGGSFSPAPPIVSYENVSYTVEIATFTYTPPYTAPTCTISVSPNPGQIGQNVTWTASPVGGNGTYTYSWSGTEGLAGSPSSVIGVYSSAGHKTAHLVVTSTGLTGSCDSAVDIVAPTIYTTKFKIGAAANRASIIWANLPDHDYISAPTPVTLPIGGIVAAGAQFDLCVKFYLTNNVDQTPICERLTYSPATTPTPPPTATPNPTSTPTTAPTPTPTPIACTSPSTIGDADGLGTGNKVCVLDFNIWKNEKLGILTTRTSDFNCDHAIDILDFNIWRAGYLANPIKC